MKVAGFTIIRNAIKFDYPVVAAITSILPICDIFIVSIGQSDDGTEELIKSIDSPKIKIVHSLWDDSLREGGKVLAVETNKAKEHIPKDIDWAFYIQSDEVVHEKYLPSILQSMKDALLKKHIDGLLFKYLHFYGSYDYVGDSRKWYRNEIRIIRNLPSITSYKDAQGFRINDQKLKVVPINAYIYHYGWVKHPKYQQAKQLSFNKMWHNDNWVNTHVEQVHAFDYSKIDHLKKFKETHPRTILPRIQKMNWDFSFDPTKRNTNIKKRFLQWIEKKTGWRIGEYKNYTIVN